MILLGISSCSSSCNKPEQKPAPGGEQQPGTEQPAPTQPGPEATTTPPTQPAIPAQPGQPGQPPGVNPMQSRTYTPISPDKYWQIMIERLDVTKQYYQDMIAVYKKYPNEADKATPEIMELKKSVQQKSQEVFTKNGLSMGQNFYPNGPDRVTVLQERSQYIKDHPELELKYKALRDEMNDLRQELMQYTGRDERMKGERGGPGGRPHGPGRTMPGGPGMPGMPGNAPQPGTAPRPPAPGMTPPAPAPMQPSTPAPAPGATAPAAPNP